MLDWARLLRSSALRGSTQLFLVNNFLATIETFYVCGYAVLGGTVNCLHGDYLTYII